jgi:hypothetical protein
MLRPFFQPLVPLDDPEILDAKNWEYGTSLGHEVRSNIFELSGPDISSADFPGIYPAGAGFVGPMPKPESHPHLRLEQTMVSVPKVYPGDAVFWHCDVIHAVEIDHTGTSDSAGQSATCSLKLDLTLSSNVHPGLSTHSNEPSLR